MTVSKIALIPFVLVLITVVLQIATWKRKQISFDVSSSQLKERKDKFDRKDAHINMMEDGNVISFSSTKQRIEKHQVKEVSVGDGTINVHNRDDRNHAKLDAKPRLRIHCNSSGCFDPVGVNGQWVYTPNRTVLTRPGCCTRDRQVTFDFLPKPIKCQMIYRPDSFRGKKTFYQLMGGYECSCPGFVDRYTWQSQDIPMFDPNQACHLLGRRKVLLMGDSTMRQTASFLINALFPAGCQTQIIFRIADTLIYKNLGAFNRGGHWKDIVLDSRPDIVIMSVGAHVKQQNGTDATTVYRSVVDEVLNGILEMKNSSSRFFRNITFVWKTQQPRGCSKNIFLMPPAEAAQLSTRAGLFSSSSKVSYGWDLYLLSRLQELELPYLDVRMLYSRSDGHPASRTAEFDSSGDCRHFCNGPMDVVAALFQKLLVDLGNTDG